MTSRRKGQTRVRGGGGSRKSLSPLGEASTALCLHSIQKPWCVVCGVWRVLCDVWCVVCDLWCVVCGVWCARSAVPSISSRVSSKHVL